MILYKEYTIYNEVQEILQNRLDVQNQMPTTRQVAVGTTIFPVTDQYTCNINTCHKHYNY